MAERTKRPGSAAGLQRRCDAIAVTSVVLVLNIVARGIAATVPDPGLRTKPQRRAPLPSGGQAAVSAGCLCKMV